MTTAAKDPETAMETGLCGAAKRSGGFCQRQAGWGTNHLGVGRCKNHAGSTPSHELNGVLLLARRRAAVMGQPIDADPHEAILECIRIAAGEVKYASDQIQELDEADVVGPVSTTRPLKLEKGAEDPGTYVADYGPPALHIWIKVRHEAMDRLVNYSKVAIAAGIAERQVAIAESHAREFAERMRRFAVALGLEPTDPKVRAAFRESLSGPPVIEGRLAA